MRKRAVERNLEIIGEAINRIITRDGSFVDKISHAKAIIGLRNQVFMLMIIFQTMPCHLVCFNKPLAKIKSRNRIVIRSPQKSTILNRLAHWFTQTKWDFLAGLDWPH
jgi:hypothetical protein